MTDRLPMPGEKPAGVWRPREYRRASMRRRRPVLGVVVTIVVVTLAWVGLSEVSRIARSSGTPPVIIHADGELLTLHTQSTDPMTILSEADIALDPRDAVTVSRAQAGAPREVRVARAQIVIVEEGDSRVSFLTTAPTLGEALTQAAYVLYEGDQITPPLHTPVTDGLEVTLVRSVPVTLTADSHTRLIRTCDPTVSDLMTRLGITLNGDDYITPAPSTPISTETTIRVVRVTESILTEQETIPFEIDYHPDPDLELDQQRVLQEGQDGIRQRRVRIRYEDGIEVSQTILDEWLAQSPRNQIVGYGTQILIRQIETPEGTLDYWRVIRVLATSYSPSTAGSTQPGDPTFGVTATGASLEHGVIAVDPRVINFYTRIYIPGYGVGEALDTGGAVKGRRIDLGYDDENLVLWYDWVDVYLLPPVPPPDQIQWLLP